MVKGLSPIISVTILIAIALTTAAFMAGWIYDLTATTTNQTTSDAQRQVICRSAGLDFDPSYGDYGVDYNISGNGTVGSVDWIRAHVVNTGSVDLYGFSFEVTIDGAEGTQIAYYEPTPGSQKTPSSPLRPGRSAILSADVTPDINESAVSLIVVRVINTMCPDASPFVEI
jgi:FlaG/FlaF family flagellin (archaellin)